MDKKQLETWASPAPAGLTALAVACFTYFAVLTGKVPNTTHPLLGCWLLGGFVIQIVVALLELKENQLLGGNVFLFFSAYFMLVGALEFLVKASDTFAAAAPTSEIDGWAWLVLLLTLLLWTPAYLKTSSFVMGLTIIVLDVGVLFVTIRDLGVISAELGSPIAGYAMGIVGLLGIYHAAAIELNNAWGKTVLPLGKSIL